MCLLGTEKQSLPLRLLILPWNFQIIRFVKYLLAWLKRKAWLSLVASLTALVAVLEGIEGV
jgi:hypothetical protein